MDEYNESESYDESEESIQDESEHEEENEEEDSDGEIIYQPKQQRIINNKTRDIKLVEEHKKNSK